MTDSYLNKYQKVHKRIIRMIFWNSKPIIETGYFCTINALQILTRNWMILTCYFYLDQRALSLPQKRAPRWVGLSLDAKDSLLHSKKVVNLVEENSSTFTRMKRKSKFGKLASFFKTSKNLCTYCQIMYGLIRHKKCCKMTMKIWVI